MKTKMIPIRVTTLMILVTALKMRILIRMITTDVIVVSRRTMKRKMIASRE